MTHANRPTESPSRLSAMVNARHLEEVPERNLQRLADMLEDAAEAYLAVAETADCGAYIATPNGLVIAPSTMTCLLLGEQLVHGLDIARSANLPWTISRSDALLVIPGVLTVAPQYLRPSRAAGLRCSFELRRLSPGGRPGNRRCGGRRAASGLHHHRGPSRVPAPRIRPDPAVGSGHSRPTASRRAKAVAGVEVRQPAVQPVDIPRRTVGRRPLW
jgi:hypothetical protein